MKNKSGEKPHVRAPCSRKGNGKGSLWRVDKEQSPAGGPLSVCQGHTREVQEKKLKEEGTRVV